MNANLLEDFQLQFHDDNLANCLQWDFTVQLSLRVSYKYIFTVFLFTFNLLKQIKITVRGKSKPKFFKHDF